MRQHAVVKSDGKTLGELLIRWRALLNGDR
jgi:hypothetical protein